MDTFLPSTPMLLAFLFASLALAVTPGPAVFYILARSLSQGRASGLASVSGVALGNMGNMIGASFGLAALFSVSTTAFVIVKYMGALYLVFIGLQMLRAARKNAKTEVAIKSLPMKKIFIDGFLVALFNPKTALFFAAFLPQFLTPHGNHLAQGLILGLLFVVIAGITDTIYVLLASRVRKTITASSRLSLTGHYFGGLSFIGLGALTAFSGHKMK